MPDYTSKYIFEASSRGFAALNRQLQQTLTNVNALKAAAAGGININAGARAGTGGGTASGGGTTGGGGGGGSSFAAGGYLPNTAHVTRALGYATALGAVYRIMELGSEIANRWVDAQTEYNRALVDGQNILGLSAEQVRGFGEQVKYLAYISGEGISEASMVAQRETILNRPGMGAAASALNMVFPTLDLSNSAQDLTAIQTQFHASFNDINRVLLTLVRTSGLTAEELMGMSDTWGALVNDMRLGERSLTTMKQIGALMASMSVVMGETGTSIEQFLRKMERIYTDPKAAQALDQIGISITNAAGAARPFTDILNEISDKGLGAQAYAALEPLFPNDLGQATKQQLRELFLNIDTITGVVDNATGSMADFDKAVVTAAESTDNINERLGMAFDNWLTAIGDITGATNMLSTVAAGLQNQSVRLSNGGMNYGTFVGRIGGEYITERSEASVKEVTALISSLFNTAEMRQTGKSRKEISQYFVESLPSNFFGNIESPWTQQQYLQQAIGMFQKSTYFQPEHGVDQTIQDFLLYMSQYRSVVDEAFMGLSEGARFSAEALGRSVEATDAATVATSYFTTAILGAGDMAQQFLPTLYARLNNLPEVRQTSAELAERKAGFRPDPYAAGYNVMRQIDPQDWLDAQAKLQDMKWQGNIDAANERDRLADQFARQQQASWDRLMTSFEREWNNMLDSITKPTPVTAADMARSQVGGYQDKWDEPFRQWGADVNNVIAGKGAQWNFGGLSQYVDQQLLGMAMGADIDTQRSIFAGLTEELRGKYYSMQLPPEAYNREAFVASANQWIAGQQQSRETRATLEGWLRDAGIDKTLATQFLGMQDTPPIVQALTGGKSADEISDTFKTYVPDAAGIVKGQFTDVSWVMIIAGAMVTSIKENPDPLKQAGVLAAGAFNEGFAGEAAATVVAKVLEALSKI